MLTDAERMMVATGKHPVSVAVMQTRIQQAFGDHADTGIVVIVIDHPEYGRLWHWDSIPRGSGGLTSISFDAELQDFLGPWASDYGQSHWRVVRVSPEGGEPVVPFTEDQILELTIAALSVGMTLEFP
jgi:hypothetical protein